MTDLTIEHTHAEGTVLHGDPRPHHPALKTLGWRWHRRDKFWYWPNSRDRDAYQPRLEATADEMEKVGFTVHIKVDNSARSAADRIEDGMRRAEQRASRLEGAADRAEGRRDQHWQTAHDMASVIPMGQPILVGHHSEGRDRRYRARIDNHGFKGLEAAREADDLRRRAAAAAQTAAGKSVGETMRKIEELEADVRRWDRELGPPKDNHNCGFGYYYSEAEGVDCCRNCGMAMRPIGGDYRVAVEERRRRLVDELEFWRAHLANLEEQGAKIWRPEDFKKGDRVRLTYGWATVERVNKKSLTIRSDVMPNHTNTAKYDKVREKGTE